MRNYDAVYFFTSGELPLSDQQKADLLDFVRQGKGFGGSHSATDTLYTWPEYGDMIGGIFDGLANPFDATRYHSLVVRRDTLPDCLEVSAWTAEGEIMGLRHRELPVEGVQFHPESILTLEGKRLLGNFLERLG